MKSKALVITGEILISISGVFIFGMSSIPALVYSDFLNEKSNNESGRVK